MADSFVQVPANSTGVKLQTFENTVSAQVVDAEAVVLVRSSDNTEIGTSSQPVRTDPTGTTTQPVSAASLPLPTGAATAAKQPALGTAGTASSDVITIQGIASMTAVAVSAASLPLPTGASTAAKQPALGTAGTASADVITVQGIASMTALKTDGSAVTQPVSFGPVTSGGTSAYHAVAAATNNAAAVKGSAGQVYGWSIYNNAAYPIYVKLYNKATAPAPATDNALLIKVIGVQAGTHVPYFNATGIAGFSNGIGIAAVKGITDTDNTSLALSDCLIELDYK